MRYVAACEHGTWHLVIGRKGANPTTFRPVPFRCRSWRHPGECSHWKASQDFARIAAAIETRDDWVYATLTFAQRDWDDWKDQYRKSGQLWSKLRHRLQWRFGKIAYIQTWERHKAQGIHVNLLLGSEELLCKTEEAECSIVAKRMTKQDRGRYVAKKVFNGVQKECGFGRIAFMAAMRDGTSKAMAGYFTKLAKELVGADAKGQIPFDAPAHFRRLRASRGLLPPVIKSGATGCIVFHPMPWHEVVDRHGELLEGKR